MKDWWKYALVGAGCSLITGAAGAAGMYVAHQRGFEKGYDKGYNESEPEILVFTQEIHGYEGMCVVKNEKEMVCAIDVDYNGSVDLILIDTETQEVKEFIPGTVGCSKKKSLEEELQNNKKD